MLKIKPIHLKQANEYVKKYHRHNIPTVGGKFAISCYNGLEICGVAICGRPISRKLDDGKTLEIYRCCTNGQKNACSKLYSAAVKIAKYMGYSNVITYTLESEPGVSLKAAGFICQGKAGGNEWTGNRKRDYYISPKQSKKRWIKILEEQNEKT